MLLEQSTIDSLEGMRGGVDREAELIIQPLGCSFAGHP